MERETKNGVMLKYANPPDARMPTKKWRLYMFKNDKSKVMHLHRKATHLFGEVPFVLVGPHLSEEKYGS